MQTTSDVATVMYYTGIDPFTRKPVYIAKQLKDRKLQRALLQFFKPENYFAVREALLQAKRQDLIGGGCDCLIPANPPKEALEARRREAQQAVRGPGRGDHDHYHAIDKPAPRDGDQERERERRPGRPAPSAGYRPGRKTQRRQERRPRDGA